MLRRRSAGFSSSPASPRASPPPSPWTGDSLLRTAWMFRWHYCSVLKNRFGLVNQQKNQRASSRAGSSELLENLNCFHSHRETAAEELWSQYKALLKQTITDEFQWWVLLPRMFPPPRGCFRRQSCKAMTASWVKGPGEHGAGRCQRWVPARVRILGSEVLQKILGSCGWILYGWRKGGFQEHTPEHSSIPMKL